MRLESILQRAKEAAKCEASSSSSSAHDEVPWPELKRRAIIKGLDFLLSMGETLFRNETLSSKHGADVLLPFYVPTSKAAASPEERHALKVALRLAAEWRSRAAKVVKLPPSIPPSASAAATCRRKGKNVFYHNSSWCTYQNRRNWCSRVVSEDGDLPEGD